MAEHLTANQANPFQYPGLTGDPNTTIWDMLFRTPRYRERQEENLFPDVDPLSAEDLQYYSDIMGVRPETFALQYEDMGDPGFRNAYLGSLQQMDARNRAAAARFESWRRLTGGGYQQSANILSMMPRMY